MNSKIVAFFAVFLIVASLGFTCADWLDDLNEGANRVLSTVNENGDKVQNVARSVQTIGQLLRRFDLDSDENNE